MEPSAPTAPVVPATRAPVRMPPRPIAPVAPAIVAVEQKHGSPIESLMKHPIAPVVGGVLVAVAYLIGGGYVVRNDDGTPKSDGQDAKAIQRIYKRAGVPERAGAWHLLRHSFGAHAALFGANPWSLMRWLGHKRIDETMLYVNFASDHHRTAPPEIQAAAANENDADRRIISMLSQRCVVVALGSAAVLNY